MRFAVLGPLRVTTALGDIDIPGAKERTLLLHLLARVGRTVAVEDLVETLWGERPPRAPTKALQTHVLRVRNALEPDRAGPATVLVTDAGGYRLDVPAESVDAHRFTELTGIARRAAAEGRHAAAVAAFDDALALWRGPAYAGLRSSGFAEAEARRLDELRLDATEDRWAAALEIGAGAATAAEVQALLEEHPYRERLWALLVLAHYRVGRQADALAAYERARRRLADDLGVDPGPDLRALHRRVLDQDPVLAAPAPQPSVPSEAASPLTVDQVRAVVASMATPPDVDDATRWVLDGGDLTPDAVRRRAAAWVRRTVGARVHDGSAVLARSAAEVDALRSRMVEDLAAVEAAGGGPGPGTTCPWRGLAAYGVEDADWFAGRERLVAELVARVATDRLVTVVGASGSGKSSLVRAGLLAALRDGRLPGSDEWTVVTMRPGAHPMRELARGALAAAGRHPGAGEALAQLLAPASATRTLLLVDQLEEVFTLCSSPDERAEFLDTVAGLVAAADGAVTVVLAVRADFVVRLADRTVLTEAASSSTVLVGQPTPAEVARAVRVPAERAGLVFEPGLDDALVHDAGAEPGLLPLLSASLTRLWEQRDGRLLTWATYVAGGGLSGAIAHLAEESHRSLTPEQQVAARVLFLRLAGPGTGAGVVRRRVPVAEIERLPVDTATVLARLADARLLTLGDGHVEVAHESLFREWPRLAGWLAEDTAGRDVQRRLAVAAAEWEVASADPALLWRGTRLESALDVAATRPDELTTTEHAFLDAGRRAVDAERADAERRAEAAQRHNRRLRAVLAGLAVVLVVALVASVVAVLARRDAVAAGERQAAAALAASAKRLAAQSVSEENLDLALLQAVEAVRTERSPETYGALLTLLGRVPALVRQTRSAQFLRGDVADDGRTVFLSEYEPRVWAFHARSGVRRWRAPVPGGGNVWTLDAGPPGLLGSVHTAGAGLLVLWDPETGRERWRLADDRIGRFLGPEADPWPGDALWLPDGRAAFVTSSHVVLVGAGGRLLRAVPIEVAASPSVVRAWPDGRLSFGAPDGSGHILDPATGRSRSLPFVVESVSPDGSLVVTVDRTDPDRARVRLRRSTDFAPVGEEMVVGSFDWGLDWAPHGRTFVIGAGESAQLRDRRGRVLHELSGGHSGAIMVALLARGDRVWTGGRDGVASTWDLRGATGVIRSRPLTGSPFGGQATADGSLGVSVRVYVDRLNEAHLVHPDAARVDPAPLPLPAGCTCQVQDVAVAADGSVLAGSLAEWTGRDFAEDRGRVALWSPSGELLGQVRLPWTPMGVGLSPDGSRVAVNGTAGYAVADTSSRELVVGPVADPGGPLRSGAAARFSPDGRRLALMRDRVVVVDPGTGRVLAEQEPGDGPGDLPTTAEWSADGDSLSVSTFDARLLFLRPDTLEPWAPTRQAAAGLVADQATSPDGRLLATLGSDGDVRLWDAASGAPLGLPLTEENVPGMLVFDAAGRTLRVLHEAGAGAEDGRMRVIDTDPEAWVAQACRIANRQLSEDEWQVAWPGRPWRRTCP